MAETLPAKDRALNLSRVARIGQEVKAACPAFDATAFTTDVMRALPHLELKARIARVATGLHDHLPVTGPAALDVLLSSLPATPQVAGVVNDFGLHLYAPHSDFVARYCRRAETLQAALDALPRFTCYFSAEDAVRFFLNDFPEQTMSAVRVWAGDSDYRVRRLASEATRPALPWSVRVALRPGETLPILDQLHTDPHRFVTASVANHLRDIAATDPQLVVDTLITWRTRDEARSDELEFVCREALKTNLKQGWPPAYRLLGFDSGLPVDVGVRLDRDALTDGETLAFTTDVTSPVAAPVHVMYVISGPTSRGARREKVYFLSRATAQPGAALSLAKRHLLRSTATSRIVPGPHTLEIQVNGNRHDPVSFEVLGCSETRSRAVGDLRRFESDAVPGAGS